MNKVHATYKKQLYQIDLAFNQKETIDENSLSDLAGELLSHNFFDLYSWCIEIICSHYNRINDFEKFKQFSEQLKNVAEEQNGYPLIYSLLLDSREKIYKLDYEESIKRLDIAQSIYEEQKLNDPFLLFKIKHHLSASYIVSGEKVKAYRCYLEALQCNLYKSCAFHKAKIYNALGNFENRNYNFKEALFNYLKSAEILKKNSIFSKLYVSVLHSIGTLNLEMGKHEESFQAFSETLNISNQVNDLNQKISVMTNLGRYYMVTENYDKAEECLLSEIDIDNTFLAPYLGLRYLLLGDLYAKMNRFDEAYAYYDKVLQKRVYSNQYLSLHDIYCCIANLFLQQNDLKKTKEFIEKAEKILPNLNDLYAKKALYELYTKYYEAKKIYKKALEYSKLYNEVIIDMYTAKAKLDIDISEVKFEISRNNKGE